MSIIKQKQEIDFTQVANEVLRSKDLSFKAKGVFAYLYSKPENWDFASERIMIEAKDGKKSIQAGLRELENFGYLKRLKLPSGRMDYELSWKPKSQKGALDKKPKCQKGKVPKGQGAETGPISNTDIISNTDSINNIVVPPKKVINFKKQAREFFESGSLKRATVLKMNSDGIQNSKYILESFCDYWTEQNSKGKMKFELQKTYELSKRLKTWIRNQNKWDGEKLQNNKKKITVI